MSDPNIKQLTVTGNAAESFLNTGTGTRKRRRTSANKTQKNEKPVVGKEGQRDGLHVAKATTTDQRGGTSPGTIVQIQANKAPDAPEVPFEAKSSTSTALAKNVTNSSFASVKEQAGGKPSQTENKEKKSVAVILAGGKKKGAKVILSPTKIKKLPGLVQTQTHQSQTQQGKTRKIAKKIRMSLHGFGKRVTRANHIRKEATKQPIADVKKTLVEAKLIKPESKAPEDILRKMYADYMMLKNRAL